MKRSTSCRPDPLRRAAPDAELQAAPPVATDRDEKEGTGAEIRTDFVGLGARYALPRLDTFVAVLSLPLHHHTLYGSPTQHLSLITHAASNLARSFHPLRTYAHSLSSLLLIVRSGGDARRDSSSSNRSQDGSRTGVTALADLGDTHPLTSIAEEVEGEEGSEEGSADLWSNSSEDESDDDDDEVEEEVEIVEHGDGHISIGDVARHWSSDRSRRRGGGCGGWW